jgi:hypothetical protein
MANLINGQNRIDAVYDRIREDEEYAGYVTQYVIDHSLPAHTAKGVLGLSAHALAERYVATADAVHARTLAIQGEWKANGRNITYEGARVVYQHRAAYHNGAECPDGCTAGWQSDNV